MTLQIVVFLALAFLLFLTGPGAAHSPSVIQLTYDQAAGEMIVSMEYGDKR
jgi:hypothetical protein